MIDDHQIGGLQGIGGFPTRAQAGGSERENHCERGRLTHRRRYGFATPINRSGIWAMRNCGRNGDRACAQKPIAPSTLVDTWCGFGLAPHGLTGSPCLGNFLL